MGECPSIWINQVSCDPLLHHCVWNIEAVWPGWLNRSELCDGSLVSFMKCGCFSSAFTYNPDTFFKNTWRFSNFYVFSYFFVAQWIGKWKKNKKKLCLLTGCWRSRRSLERELKVALKSQHDFPSIFSLQINSCWCFQGLTCWSIFEDLLKIVEVMVQPTFCRQYHTPHCKKHLGYNKSSSTVLVNIIAVNGCQILKFLLHIPLVHYTQGWQTVESRGEDRRGNKKRGEKRRGECYHVLKKEYDNLTRNVHKKSFLSFMTSLSLVLFPVKWFAPVKLNMDTV